MNPKSIDNRKILFILDEIRQVENRLQNLRQEVLTLLPPAPVKKPVFKKHLINGKIRQFKI